MPEIPADQVTAYVAHVSALIKTAQSGPGDAETEHVMVTELFPRFVAAVEAVLELHQPAGSPLPGRQFCVGCVTCAAECLNCENLHKWPCATDQIISRELLAKEDDHG